MQDLSPGFLGGSLVHVAVGGAVLEAMLPRAKLPVVNGSEAEDGTHSIRWGSFGCPRYGVWNRLDCGLTLGAPAAANGRYCEGLNIRILSYIRNYKIISLFYGRMGRMAFCDTI